jgi:tetratricopeptide (TPR) repeat protein
MNTTETIENLMRNARWREAQRACREVLFDRPTDAKIHAYEGLCFFRLAEFAAAEPCFMRAAALEPTFLDAAVKRIQCLERLQMFDEAVHVAKEWRSKRPSHPELNRILRTYGHRPNPYRTDAWESNLHHPRAMAFAESA